MRIDSTLPLQLHIMLEVQLGDDSALDIPAVVIRATGPQSYGTAFAELSEADADRLMDLAAQCLKTAAPAPWYLG